MIHKCKYCDYESPYRPNMKRHEKSKHGAQEPSSHQHAKSNQSGIGVNSTPPNWFMAQHPHGYEYAKESRAPTKKSYGPDYQSAPTKISVGPNEPMPPTTISVPPVRERVQHGDGITIKINDEDDTDVEDEDMDTDDEDDTDEEDEEETLPAVFDVLVDISKTFN